MNIQILDSWIKEFVKTKATAKEIAEKLSLTSVSIERVEKWKNDFLYDIEITSNRPDLASVIGIAREASTVLPQFGTNAFFVKPSYTPPRKLAVEKATITIEDKTSAIKRICGVVMEVTVKETPEVIKNRLEASGGRSLNNLIDITNYVMKVTGHPVHVFDYDRLNTNTLLLRESKPGEKITTLDKKDYVLPGGDLIAEDGKGRIVDLLGIMGLENSVVTSETKRILFFIDNNDEHHIRKTSMHLGIRTEAAQLNEKGIDPELAYDALLYGIELYQKLAEGKLLSNPFDIYPNKYSPKKISVSEEKINSLIGIKIPLKQSGKILSNLGFHVDVQNETLEVTIPSFRADDINIAEDVIEEIARIFGYHNLPSVLPPMGAIVPYTMANEFYFERRVKEAMKYWGFTETYTYSMVSEEMFEGPTETAVTIANPLTQDWVYMRRTLIPSLLKVLTENKNRDLSIFEISNIYEKKKSDLPNEVRHFAGIVKKPHVSFYEIKGLIEQLSYDLGINEISFKHLSSGGTGAEIYVKKEHIGSIELLDEDLINFEINFDTYISHATLHKKYTPLSKYPPVVEDISVIIDETILTGEIIDMIKKQSDLIVNVSLLEKWKDTRTFHIVYQDKERNLTSGDIEPVRLKIINKLKDTFNATIK